MKIATILAIVLAAAVLLGCGSYPTGTFVGVASADGTPTRRAADFAPSQLNFTSSSHVDVSYLGMATFAAEYEINGRDLRIKMPTGQVEVGTSIKLDDGRDCFRFTSILGIVCKGDAPKIRAMVPVGMFYEVADSSGKPLANPTAWTHLDFKSSSKVNVSYHFRVGPVRTVAAEYKIDGKDFTLTLPEGGVLRGTTSQRDGHDCINLDALYFGIMCKEK